MLQHDVFVVSTCS